MALSDSIAATATVSQAVPTPFIWSPTGAAVITGIVAIIVLMANAIINTRMHSEKLKSDKSLAKERFNLDRELSQRKFDLDQSLDDWRRKTAFAEQELASFYEASDRFSAIRSPGSFGYESDDRSGRDEEPEQVRRRRDTYYPILRRIRENGEFFNGFYAKRHRAIALFGPGSDTPYRQIWQALHSVSVAAQMLMRDGPAQNQQQIDFERSMEGRIWEGASDPDVLAAQVTSAVAAAEAMFRPAINPPRRN